MQASKIKLGAVYALPRPTVADRDAMVRFHVDAIVTQRNASRTTNEAHGWIYEDRKKDEPLCVVKVPVEKLLGPYEEQVALVERKRQEDADREARAKARTCQWEQDRLALYAWVGMTPPQKADDFKQLFRIAYNGVDITQDGVVAILKQIKRLSEDKR